MQRLSTELGTRKRYIRCGVIGRLTILQNSPRITVCNNLMSHRFTTKLDEDDYGDLILTIPYEICEELGWSVKTELQFELSDDGQSINLKPLKDD